jgi:hypothetical protein
MKNRKESFKTLKLEEDEVDGICFSVNEEETNEERVSWNFSIMKMNESEDKDFTLHELGYKYHVVLYKNNEAEVFEAIIGDLKYYVNNLVKVNQEGLIIKKCKKSEEILNKIFRGELMEALANGLMRVAEQKAEAV